MTLVLAALVVNILVAGYFGLGLTVRKSHPALETVYGTDTPARRILGCLYLAIAITSLIALLWSPYTLTIISVLFPVQIIYKLLTIPAIGSFTHPVVLSNFFISILLASAWYHTVL